MLTSNLKSALDTDSYTECLHEDAVPACNWTWFSPNDHSWTHGPLKASTQSYGLVPSEDGRWYGRAAVRAQAACTDFPAAAHDVQPREWPHKENQWLESKRLLAPVLFDRDQGQSLDSFECLVIWFFCFTVFAYTFESETSYYLQYARGVGSTSASTSILLTSLTCLIVVALLYNHNYFYDPVTIACAILAMRALRKEQLPALAVLTAIFAVNRETAFIVPGLTFFYWFHLRERKRALGQAALLSTIYLAITGIILFHYRHNPGHLSQNHRAFLIHMYLHQKLPFMVAGILALVAYGIAVARRGAHFLPH